jgi:hypothetical protein
MEGCTKCITDDLKDIAIAQFNCRRQNGVMMLPQRLPFFGMFLREFGAAFNIREEKSNSAGGKIIHRLPVKHNQ